MTYTKAEKRKWWNPFRFLMGEFIIDDESKVIYRDGKGQQDHEYFVGSEPYIKTEE